MINSCEHVTFILVSKALKPSVNVQVIINRFGASKQNVFLQYIVPMIRCLTSTTFGNYIIAFKELIQIQIQILIVLHYLQKI